MVKIISGSEFLDVVCRGALLSSICGDRHLDSDSKISKVADELVLRQLKQDAHWLFPLASLYLEVVLDECLARNGWMVLSTALDDPDATNRTYRMEERSMLQRWFAALAAYHTVRAMRQLSTFAEPVFMERRGTVFRFARDHRGVVVELIPRNDPRLSV